MTTLKLDTDEKEVVRVKRILSGCFSFADADAS
jgi:hypothetical protein